MINRMAANRNARFYVQSQFTAAASVCSQVVGAPSCDNMRSAALSSKQQVCVCVGVLVCRL